MWNLSSDLKYGYNTFNTPEFHFLKNFTLYNKIYNISTLKNADLPKHQKPVVKLQINSYRN